MNNFFKRTLQGDRIVWILFFALCFVSIVEMFSASSFLVSKTGSIHGPILRHVMFIGVGFVIMLIVQLIEFKYVRFIGYIGLAISWVLLVYTLLFGVEQAGAARFLSVAGFQFQPSEFAKISLIIVVADQIERMQMSEYQAKAYWMIAAVIGVTCALIFLENLSTAAILFVITMTMMWIGEVNWKRLAATVSVVIVGVGLVLGIAMVIPEETFHQSDNKILGLFERAYTWVARIENFAGEDSDPMAKYKITDDNYQIAHAQIAVARGGFIPHMPGSSVQRDFLPEAFSDFIFAIIVEEGGFFAGIAVILLYLILLFRAGVVARKSDSLFCAILVIGVTLMIVIQAFIHVGVSVHLGPVTGQPLPLVSRGGTSILVNCVYFGIIISVTRYIQHQQEKASNSPQVAVGAVTPAMNSIATETDPAKTGVDDEPFADSYRDDVIVEIEEP